MALIKLGFSAPRKKAVSNLTAGLRFPKEQILAAFAEVGISPDARPADLTIENWVSLEKALKL